MNQLNRLIRNGHPNQGLRSVVIGSPLLRWFSTESAPSTTSNANQSSASTSTGPFFESPSTGLYYGRLWGITKYTSKTDILSLFEDPNLNRDDLKISYDRAYIPTSMVVQFPSRYAFDAAIKVVFKKGRLYRLEAVDRASWDYLQPYDGKFVLLQGIPPNASPDDVDRFLYGYEYEITRLFYLRPGTNDATRAALVRFPSPTAAMSAVINKNTSFCLNNRISMHVLD